mgnify:CR=1 FL=1
MTLNRWVTSVRGMVKSVYSGDGLSELSVMVPASVSWATICLPTAPNWLPVFFLRP